MNRSALYFCIFLLFVGNVSKIKAQTKAHEINQKLGRGVNLGNCFEAPSEGEWGVSWDAEYFKILNQLGFHSVRIPIRWEPSDRSLSTAPYTISETFFKRIDNVIQSALDNNLMVIVNMHHHDELLANPDANLERFKSMWKQIATRYTSCTDSLVFEILNEPNGNLTSAKWNTFLRAGINEIRDVSPNRTILIGTPNWGGIGGLSELTWPTDIQNLILTVHYYNPFQFTHQGAEWTGNESQAWLGSTWDNTEAERNTIENELKLITSYSRNYQIPVNIGEFGAYNKADIASRERWTTFCARTFENKGFSWNYWEFCSGFGFYNAQNKTIIEPLVRALQTNPMPSSTPVIKNMVYEANFNSGNNGFIVFAQQGATATGAVNNRTYKISITQSGTLGWHIQALVPNIKLEKGKTYQIEFEAWTDSTRMISTSIGMNINPWSSYSSTLSTQLTSEKILFIYQFKMTSETDNAARLIFDLGGSTHDVYLDNVSISEITLASAQVLDLIQFKVYPNPCNKQITIETNQNRFTYSIYDLSGQKIMDNQSENSSEKIDLSLIQSGIYVVKVNYGDQSSQQQILIKR